jgi:lipopolysaccharide transport system ATP-binding protein
LSSGEIAIRFREVSKRYPVTRVGSGGMKGLLLHLPRYIAALCRKAKTFTALDEVSFEVARGECLGIIGRNGSGKSTTLGLIAGVLRPSAGAIETRGKIAPLLELGAGFHAELSGRDNIILNGILLGLTRARVLENMDRIIEFSEMAEFMDQPLRTYSSGMVARLGFSVAVHLSPEILLIDEVLAVGDEAFQRKCIGKIQEFRARGVTMVFVTHNLGDVEKSCDRVAMLAGGRLVEIGKPAEVVRRYRSSLAGR